ncbi:MAG: RluA family pseudouridine synthase [Candidatus Gracilibacteria bacterium]|jgi:23S rRNA pseudouridine1911/1915/1917 synthase
MQFQSIIIKDKDSTARLDQFLAPFLKLTRNQVQRLIKEGCIFVNHKPEKANTKLKTGDKILYRIPEAEESKLVPEKIPLEIIFEDKDFLVINKSAGMVVHPDESGHNSGTVVHAVLAHSKNLSGIGGKKRPGIVHRLDKDTSGVLLIAKNDKTHQKFSKLFQDRKVEKSYLALVKGTPKSQKGRIEAPIGRSSNERKKMAVSTQGKTAISSFEVLAIYRGVSLLKVKIETGRTHQIRVHLASIGHPVVGDPVYGDKKLNAEFKEKHGLTRQFLHAAELKIDGKTFQAPLPEDLEKVKL